MARREESERVDSGVGRTSEGLVRVRAGSYREALATIHERFGDGVRIVHTRSVKRDGLLGVVGARGVEIYLTTREDFDDWQRVRERAEGGAPQVAEHSGTSRRIAGPTGTHERRREPGVVGEKKEPSKGSGPRPGAAGDLSARIQRYLRENRVDSSSRSGGEPREPRAPRSGPAHPVVRAACVLLRERGFSQEIANELIRRLQERRIGEEGDEEDHRRAAHVHLGELLQSELPACAPISLEGPRSGRPRVVALVGPTGAGKTTTIAKLAAPLKLVHGLRVGLITLDTYRIGALEQIRRYGEILGLPVAVVDADRSLARAIEELSSCEVLLVDTAGCSQRNGALLVDMQQQFRELSDLEVHLCLPANTTREFLVETAERFEQLGAHRTILTKLDESVVLGHLVDLFRAVASRISYLTCGQNVPEDLLAASVERLENLLLGEPTWTR